MEYGQNMLQLKEYLLYSNLTTLVYYIELQFFICGIN